MNACSEPSRASLSNPREGCNMGQQPRTENGPPLYLRLGTQGRRWVKKKTNGRTFLEGARSVKWVGKSEFLGYGRESGSRSPMRKEAEAKLIISFQSQEEKTAMLYLLKKRPLSTEDQMGTVQRFALQNRFKIIHKFQADWRGSSLQRVGRG